MHSRVFFIHTCSDTSSNHPVTIGLVGYPNVGKSSTINALLQEKKVPVSATPGRTKHFQVRFDSSLKTFVSTTSSNCTDRL